MVTPFVGVWIETIIPLLIAMNTPSHPSWVCGLKHQRQKLVHLRLCVTPFVGVWIETAMCLWGKPRSFVTPFVGVWIETSSAHLVRKQALVTPFVGVWIETNAVMVVSDDAIVTPFVGVWIETEIEENDAKDIMSHPSWVCGLKLLNGWQLCKNR